jgi:hypothetical protein
MSSPTELKAQLARAEQALLEAEKEIDRQRKAAAEAAAAAAEENIPEGAKALIAAVSKVDLPAFWDADPVGKLPNAVSLSCRSLLLSINFEDKDAYERLKEPLQKLQQVEVAARILLAGSSRPRRPPPVPAAAGHALPPARQGG